MRVISAVVQAVVLYPFTVARIRLICDVANPPKYNRLPEVVTKTFEEHGIRGFYQGFPAYLSCQLAGRFVHRFLFRKMMSLNPFQKELKERKLSGLVGSFFTVTSYHAAVFGFTIPLVNLYRFGILRHSFSMFDAFKAIFDERKIWGLYAGYGMDLFGAALATFLIISYDSVRRH